MTGVTLDWWRPLLVDLVQEQAAGRGPPAILGSLGAGGSIPELLSHLCNSWVDAGAAARAATALGARGGPQALQHLVRALRDREVLVRRSAAEALGRLSDRGAVEPLIAALADAGSGDCAAAALGAIGDARAVEPLCRALAGGCNTVRKAAAEALVRLRDPRAVEPFVRALDDATWVVRSAALAGLAALADRRAIEPLIGHLAHPDAEERKAVAGALRACGETGWGELVRGEPDDLVRLAASPDPRGASVVMRGLDAPRAWTRAVAAEALGQVRDVRALDRLIALLDDHDRQVGECAATALGKLADARALDPLRTALRKGSRVLRIAAAAALGELGGPAAVEELLSALGADEAGVRRAAAEALHHLGQPEWWELVRGELDDLGRLAGSGDPRALSPLVFALHEGQEEARRTAAEGLGRLGQAGAAGPLILACADASSGVRAAAAAALLMLGVRAVEALGTALEGPSPERARTAAIELLGKIGDPRALEPLARTLRGDAPEHVLQRTAAAMVSLGAEAVAPLSRALEDDPRETVRAIAARSLGELGDPRAVPPLVKAVGASSAIVREKAILALGQLGDGQALEALVASLRDDCIEVAAAAAGALGRLGDRKAAEPLLDALRRDERWRARREAARALLRLGDLRAVPPLVEALYSGQGDVTQDALKALRELGGWEKAQELLRDRAFAFRMIASLLHGLDVAGEGDLSFQDARGLTLVSVERGLAAASVASSLVDGADDLAEIPGSLMADSLYQLIGLRFAGRLRDPSTLRRVLASSHEQNGDQIVFDLEALLAIRNGEDSHSVYRYRYHRVREDRWL